MSIVRMYHTAADAQRPSHYREAWWDDGVSEFVIHYGKVGATGTTEVEPLQDPDKAEALLASFVAQSRRDDYHQDDEIEHETYAVFIKYKGARPTRIEETNAEKFALEYTGLLAWRGLGVIEDWAAMTAERAFTFTISAVHRSKAMKLAHTALKKTDFRADRMLIERR